MVALILNKIPHATCPDCKAALLKVAVATRLHANGDRDERALYACGAQWQYEANGQELSVYANCPSTPAAKEYRAKVKAGLEAILAVAAKYPEAGAYSNSVRNLESDLAVLRMADRSGKSDVSMYLG